MEYEHYAAIDVGSNAVRLLVKRLEDPSAGRFAKVVMLRVPVRLGQEVFTQGVISRKKIKTLCELMKAFAIMMKIYGVRKRNFRGCATAAMREASNGEEVIRKASAALGRELEVIDGAEEAAIACGQHVNNQTARRLLYVDVGGGSTEVALFERGQRLYIHSYPLGTVKMINNVDVSSALALLETDMKALALQYDVDTIVGAGGNINKLYAIVNQKDAVEQTMSVESLRTIYADLRNLSVAQRAERYNLKPDRVDVIVPAAEIFLCIATALGVDTIEVPSTGLSDGIIEDLFRRQQKHIMH